MNTWLRALLGFVFLLAAVSKLRDARAFSAALRALGIERPAFRIGVPLAEAVLGLWLWTGWAPRVSAVTASAVLVFLTLVLIHLRRTGYTGTCGCFIGDDGPVSTLQIVRNAILFVLSLCAGLGAVPALFAAGAVLPALVLWGRRFKVAPRIELTDLAGEPVVLGQPKGDAQLVVFAMGRCPGCLRDRDLLNRLRPPALEAVIVCGGDLEAAKEFASEVRPPVRVVADPRWRAAVAWQVTTTPFSALVDRNGHVRARGNLTSTLSRVEHEVL